MHCRTQYRKELQAHRNPDYELCRLRQHLTTLTLQSRAQLWILLDYPCSSSIHVSTLGSIAGQSKDDKAC